MRIICIAILVITCSLVHGQTDTTGIANIRNTVTRINNDTEYTTRTLDNEEFLAQMTDGGGQLTGYYKNGELVKIVERIGLSACVNITEYYFQDGQLIFCYMQVSEFRHLDSAGNLNWELPEIAFEGRFYFHQEKLVHALLTGSSICTGKPDKDWSESLLSAGTRYSTLLSQK